VAAILHGLTNIACTVPATTARSVEDKMSFSDVYEDVCSGCGETSYLSGLKFFYTGLANDYDGYERFCEECKPELFKPERRKITLISHVEGQNNPANSTYVNFLTELTSLFAKNEYTMIVDDAEMISIRDKDCNNVGWLCDIFKHDDVADDYHLEARVGNRPFDDINITITRACCKSPKLETTTVDAVKGIGYTICGNCATKRDWK